MGGSSSSTSSSTRTIYEPDKVRAAEINKEKAIELEKLKGNNIKLQKEAKIEIIETNARMEALIVEAKVRGFDMAAQILVTMTKELNLLGEQRIAMIENASASVLKKINEHYLDFKQKINDDTNKFMLGPTIDMLNQLEKFDKDSDAYQMYKKQIDTHTSDFLSNQNKYVNQVLNQQDKMLDSNIELRKNINTHINSIVENRVKHLEMAVENHKDVKALDLKNQNQIEE